MTVRAVLWDLDGTLTDSVRFVVDTANRVIEAHGGSQLAFESVGAMTGLPLEEIFRMAWPDLTPDLAQRYRTEYRDIYDREMIPATKLYDGARETLHAFHGAGLLQATVTGKRAADCARILRGLGIASEIDVYLGGDSVSRPKPAPDLAQHAMARLRCAPSRVRRHRRRQRGHRDGRGRRRAHHPGAVGVRPGTHRWRGPCGRHVGGSP